MTTNRVPKDLVRARMAATGETYQQAFAAVRAQVPDAHLMPAQGGPCVGSCLSQFLADDACGGMGGSMVDCARCPGSVCVECGRAPVTEPFACCQQCQTALDKAARDRRLAERCAGRTCISRERAGTSDSDSASHTCESCGWSMCFCGRAPVEDRSPFCDDCDRINGDQYDAAYWEFRERERLLQDLQYLAGLIVKLGGGRHPEVHRMLSRKLGVRRREDASAEQLQSAVDYASERVADLRDPFAG